MAQYKFGTGVLRAVNSVANSTPIAFGAIQDVSVDFSGNVKQLFGQYQFPLAVARGQVKISGKAKFAQVNGRLYNDLFFGQTLAVGQLVTANDEAGTIPGTPYQITVTNTATFVQDFGVRYTATGLPLTKVASAPATGQYSVSGAGVYTFAAADTTMAVLISYSYTIAGSGSKIVVANLLQGNQPFFKVGFNTIYNSKQAYVELNQCVSSKLQLASKMEDWNIEELDFEAFADAANNIATVSFAE